MVNVYFLTGLGFLVLLIPTQSFIGKINDRLRRIVTKKCDKRINLLNEFLNGIKIIKLNCWVCDLIIFLYFKFETFS